MKMSLADTYDLFMFSVISIGVFVGYIGMWNLYPDRRNRIIAALIFGCLWIAQARIADE